MYSQEVAWLLEEKYNGEKSAAFFADCERLEAGEPLAYLIGHTPFLGTTITLSSKPLIPRPETEYWVELALREMREQQNRLERPLRILDLCAGSGAIGVAVAADLTNSQVDFIEIESGHLATILDNCKRNGIDERRVRVLAGNLLRDLPKTQNRRYDFILSNPPYIDKTLNRTDKSVTEHEPSLALYGGEAGLELIAEIIASAPEYLASGGQLWLEHEPEQSTPITTLGELHFRTITHQDQYKQERFSQLVLQY